MVYNWRQLIMKKLLLTFVAMATSAMCFAQLQLATLEHEDSVSVYYGASALIEAHAAAVDGDIITLSPGMFTATDLTKLVTVRGAGMFNDTAAGVVRTTITGNFNIGTDSLNTSSPHHYTLEGLYCPGTIKYKKVYSPYLVKCFFNRFDYYNQNGRFTSAQIVNCIIAYFGVIDDDGFTSCQLVNSVFVYGRADRDGPENCAFTNCIVNITYGYTFHQSNQFYNSILYTNSNIGLYHDNQTPRFWNSYSSDYCIGINTLSDSTKFYYGILPADRHLHNYKTMEAVFKNFNGTFIDGETSFELQDSIATTILGSDGTQVGIYGGPMPFDPYVYNHKVTAARRTTPDGFLDLEIKLYDEE